ncbi:SET domain-containing protein 9 [Lobosporangium transversale]|nr:SET domain-containing protein 9 [Lobosporangium transversale]
MRDFLHRFYPYQALRLMLQRMKPTGATKATSIAAGRTKKGESNIDETQTRPEFDAVQAQRQLVSLFNALKQTVPVTTPKENGEKTRTNDSNIRVRQSVLEQQQGFCLKIGPSRIPNAGLGVFLYSKCPDRRRTIAAGTVVAMYPGVLFEPGEATFFNSIHNRYILKCNDGIYVDGKAKGLSGSIFRSVNGRDNFPGTISTADTTWMVDWNLYVKRAMLEIEAMKGKEISSAMPLISVSRNEPPSDITLAKKRVTRPIVVEKEDENEDRGVEGGRRGEGEGEKGETEEGEEGELRVPTGVIKNPLAVGQIVNNGTRLFPSNVRYQELDIETNDCPLELQEFLPNIWYSRDWHTNNYDHDHDHDHRHDDNSATDRSSSRNNGSRYNTTDQGSQANLNYLRTVVLVTTKPVKSGEELYSTYIEQYV